MEFGKKLQQLRKERKMTQEELADTIFISRTAVSKWESGRGYPGIDSLKMISKLFSISIDKLISNEELIFLAENENKEKTRNLMDIVFGILDCIMGLLFFLPFFVQQIGGVASMVSLFSFKDVVYIYVPYMVFVSLNIAFGILILAFQNFDNNVWVKIKLSVSVLFSILNVLIFMASGQPYVAVFVFSLLVTKGILLVKQR